LLPIPQSSKNSEMSYLTRGFKPGLYEGQFASWSKLDRTLFRLLFFIPLINAAADCTIYYFVDVNAGGLHSGIIRGALLLLFLLLFGFRRLLKTPVNLHIFVFLIYLLVLTIFSSRSMYSFTSGYIKWFISLLMFPVGYYFFRSYDHIIRLLFFMVLGASFVCVNLLVAQFTGYGISAYVQDSFYLGGAGVGITNQLAYVLLTYPILLRSAKKFTALEKWFIYLIGLSSIVFIIIAMKRAGMLGLSMGALIYFGFTRNKRKVVKYIVLAATITILILPFFSDIIEKRYEERKKQTENYEEAGRYKEFFFVINEFQEGNVWQKLFGNEIFNTGEFFGLKYFNRERMIHGDMSSMFYGSGLVGILMYLYLFVLIFIKGAEYFKKVKNNKTLRELMAGYFAMLFAIILVSATGSGTIGEKCLVFLYLGAISGLMAHMVPASEVK
jgi:hypothetical protein